MKAKAMLILALAAWPLGAHRLDEYLQAMIVSLGQHQMHASLRLVPGVAVSSRLIAAIDLNHDGVFSESEQRTYALAVVRDLTFEIDGQRLEPRLGAIHFPAAAEMHQGLGEIQMELSAPLPAGSPRRTLTIENHHRPDVSVYLMNCLAPRERDVQVLAQQRNENQSFYRVEFVSGAGEAQWPAAGLSQFRLSPWQGFPRWFRLGMSHIAEGTDHLLFLLALLLPAPLVASGARWSKRRATGSSLRHVLRIVTAFTLGHSCTLALGAFGWVWLPSRLVEVLVAFSILISAVRALRPLFPGREPVIAAVFGLVHGLAFAATLQQLGVGVWQRVTSLLGFNLGIETMQLLVVGAILPSLILLSRTSVYAWLRVAGGLFAGGAALGWMGARVMGVASPVDQVVDAVAQRGVWLAGGLLVVSLVGWAAGQWAFPVWFGSLRSSAVEHR